MNNGSYGIQAGPSNWGVRWGRGRGLGERRGVTFTFDGDMAH